MNTMEPCEDLAEIFDQVVREITQKEAELWRFVLSNYGDGEFSTKQLERDFGNAAYATIDGLCG